MLWRPDNWEEIISPIQDGFCDGTGGNNYENGGFVQGMEAGADALLVALVKKRGLRYANYLDKPFWEKGKQREKGVYVFISDEQVDATKQRH